MNSNLGDFKAAMQKMLKPTRYEIEFSGAGWQKILGDSDMVKSIIAH